MLSQIVGTAPRRDQTLSIAVKYRSYDEQSSQSRIELARYLRILL